MTDQEPTMTIAEELMAQRDAVNFGTWVKGDPQRNGQACALARQENHRFLELPSPAVIFLRWVLNKGMPWEATTSVTVWNDAPGRTRQEVLDLLDDAIRRAKELGI